ncbi:MAG: EamA family transporter [Myxococcales bacterium]
MSWWAYALFAALAASATAILAKLGVAGVPSNLALAVRTSCALAFAWAVALGAGELRAVREVSARSWLFLTLSGLATGLSWLAYFRALQLAPASRVAPLDKLSLPLTIALAVLVLGEKLSWRLAAGAALMVAGALLTLGDR